MYTTCIASTSRPRISFFFYTREQTHLQADKGMLTYLTKATSHKGLRLIWKLVQFVEHPLLALSRSAVPETRAFNEACTAPPVRSMLSFDLPHKPTSTDGHHIRLCTNDTLHERYHDISCYVVHLTHKEFNIQTSTWLLVKLQTQT